MSIEQTDKIDFVSVNSGTGVATLTVTDHLTWGQDDDQHIILLQQKFETYLRAIETGEFHNRYPNAKNRPVRIEVVGKYPLSDLASKFFDYAGTFAAGSGTEICFRLG